MSKTKLICPNCFGYNCEKIGVNCKDRRHVVYECQDCQTMFDRRGTANLDYTDLDT